MPNPLSASTMAAVLAAAALFSATPGAAISITSFSDLPGGLFHEVGSSLPFPTTAFPTGPVTITSLQSWGGATDWAAFLCAGLATCVVGDPAVDPGDFDTAGWAGTGVDAVLDFSIPVTGFGATFVSHYLQGGSLPVTLSVFDGPGGTGNLLGTVTSAGSSTLGSPRPLACCALIVVERDFVGVFTGEANIQSAVIFSNDGLPGGDTVISVSGFGLTVAVPEPGALGLLALGLGGLAGFPRRRGRPVRGTMAASWSLAARSRRRRSRHSSR